MSENAEDIEFKRLGWHSRRGMLELDVLLGNFLKHRFRQLDDEDKLRYRKLLTAEDSDLYSWLMRTSQPQDPDMARMVGLILDYARPD
ncbi:MAG: succinate dehydrogenase assembly factor 2 [Oleiphilaceae bacterium]|nr:succinate dehydrogenase assembly factor 2 [Oleiphilaceae bacterium]